MRILPAIGLIGALLAVCPAARALDPAAAVFQLPDQIAWHENSAAGNASAALYGDPAKPGLYIQLVKWHGAISATRIFIRTTV